ncbi:hypothetical protein D3C79_1053930 [compost metagenome]
MDQDQDQKQIKIKGTIRCALAFWGGLRFVLSQLSFLRAVATQIVGTPPIGKSEANCALDLDLLPR